MYNVLVLGAGKIGSAVAKFLARTGDFHVTLGDIDTAALGRVSSSFGASPENRPYARHLETKVIDVADPAALVGAMKGKRSVLSACSYSCNPAIAKAALTAGACYFDLTEDVATTRTIRELSNYAQAGQIFMPQCGLAPGFISIAANALCRNFECLDEVRMRVGALPQFPSNTLKYNLTWSTDGLINEYCNKCEAIYQGEKIEVLPLEGLEHFSLDGIDYEAFNTSGGLGTLCDSLQGKVRTLDYKTVRYQGHRDLIAFLVNSLRLCERRGILKDILENSVPITMQDVVLVFVTVTGWRDGNLHQVTDARKIYHADVAGERHPRTVVGVSRDGKKLYVMVVDGRSEISRGMNWKELAKTIADAGAYDALNLDGGGSSTFVLRDPTTHELHILNHPSDKKERSVANVLGVTIGK